MNLEQCKNIASNKVTTGAIYDTVKLIKSQLITPEIFQTVYNFIIDSNIDKPLETDIEKDVNKAYYELDTINEKEIDLEIFNKALEILEGSVERSRLSMHKYFLENKD